jgi:hypothetical protein
MPSFLTHLHALLIWVLVAGLQPVSAGVMQWIYEGQTFTTYLNLYLGSGQAAPEIVVRNCRFTGAGYLGLNGASWPNVLTNIIVENNEFSGSQEGIILFLGVGVDSPHYNLTIRNNTFTGKSALRWGYASTRYGTATANATAAFDPLRAFDNGAPAARILYNTFRSLRDSVIDIGIRLTNAGLLLESNYVVPVTDTATSSPLLVAVSLYVFPDVPENYAMVLRNNTILHEATSNIACGSQVRVVGLLISSNRGGDPNAIIVFDGNTIAARFRLPDGATPCTPALEASVNSMMWRFAAVGNITSVGNTYVANCTGASSCTAVSVYSDYHNGFSKQKIVAFRDDTVIAAGAPAGSNSFVSGIDLSVVRGVATLNAPQMPTRALYPTDYDGVEGIRRAWSYGAPTTLVDFSGTTLSLDNVTIAVSTRGGTSSTMGLSMRFENQNMFLSVRNSRIGIDVGAGCGVGYVYGIYSYQAVGLSAFVISDTTVGIVARDLTSAESAVCGQNSQGTAPSLATGIYTVLYNSPFGATALSRVNISIAWAGVSASGVSTGGAGMGGAGIALYDVSRVNVNIGLPAALQRVENSLATATGFTDSGFRNQFTSSSVPLVSPIWVTYTDCTTQLSARLIRAIESTGSNFRVAFNVTRLISNGLANAPLLVTQCASPSAGVFISNPSYGDTSRMNFDGLVIRHAAWRGEDACTGAATRVGGLFLGSAQFAHEIRVASSAFEVSGNATYIQGIYIPYGPVEGVLAVKNTYINVTNAYGAAVGVSVEAMDGGYGTGGKPATTYSNLTFVDLRLIVTSGTEAPFLALRNATARGLDLSKLTYVNETLQNIAVTVTARSAKQGAQAIAILQRQASAGSFAATWVAMESFVESFGTTTTQVAPLPTDVAAGIMLVGLQTFDYFAISNGNVFVRSSQDAIGYSLSADGVFAPVITIRHVRGTVIGGVAYCAALTQFMALQVGRVNANIEMDTSAELTPLLPTPSVREFARNASRGYITVLGPSSVNAITVSKYFNAQPVVAWRFRGGDLAAARASDLTPTNPTGIYVSGREFEGQCQGVSPYGFSRLYHPLGATSGVIIDIATSGTVTLRGSWIGAEHDVRMFDLGFRPPVVDVRFACFEYIVEAKTRAVFLPLTSSANMVSRFVNLTGVKGKTVSNDVFTATSAGPYIGALDFDTARNVIVLIDSCDLTSVISTNGWVLNFMQSSNATVRILSSKITAVLTYNDKAVLLSNGTVTVSGFVGTQSQGLALIVHKSRIAAYDTSPVDSISPAGVVVAVQLGGWTTTNNSPLDPTKLYGSDFSTLFPLINATTKPQALIAVSNSTLEARANFTVKALYITNAQYNFITVDDSVLIADLAGYKGAASTAASSTVIGYYGYAQNAGASALALRRTALVAARLPVACTRFDGVDMGYAGVTAYLLDVRLRSCHVAGGLTKPVAGLLTRDTARATFPGPTFLFKARCVIDEGTSPQATAAATWLTSAPSAAGPTSFSQHLTLNATQLGPTVQISPCGECSLNIDCRQLTSTDQEALTTGTSIAQPAGVQSICACRPASPSAGLYYFYAPPSASTCPLPDDALEMPTATPSATASRSATSRLTTSPSRSPDQSASLTVPPASLSPPASTIRFSQVPETVSSNGTNAQLPLTSGTGVTSLPTTQLPATPLPLYNTTAPVPPTDIPPRTVTHTLPRVTRFATTAPEPAPAPQQNNVTAAKSVAAALESVMPAEAAAAVSSTASAAAMASASVNPTAASKGANLANIVGIADCGFTEDSLEPSTAQVLIPLQIGSAPTSKLFGGIVTTVGFTAVFYSISIVLSLTARQAVRARRVVAIATCAVAGYMLPSTAGFSMTMMMHGSGGQDALIGFIGAFSTALLVLVPSAVMHIHVTRHFGGKHMENPKDAIDSWAFPFIMLADGCRDTRSIPCRHLFTEDLLVAVTLGFIAGVQPESCNGVGFGILSVAALHLLYAIWFRPFETFLDKFFMLAIAIGQVLACICAIIAIDKPGMMSLVGFIAIVQAALFLAQTAAMGVMAIKAYIEKKRLLKLEKRREARGALKEMEQSLLEKQAPQSDPNTGEFLPPDGMSVAEAQRVLAAVGFASYGSPPFNSSTVNNDAGLIDEAALLSQWMEPSSPYSHAVAGGGVTVTGPLVLPSVSRFGAMYNPPPASISESYQSPHRRSSGNYKPANPLAEII